MNEELAARLTRLESALAYQEHLVEELNGVVTEQAKELERLRRGMQKQALALENIELDRIRSTNSKPPHYQ